MEREPTVGDRMAAYANDAVDHARSAAEISLDYSPGSIRDVEVVLSPQPKVFKRLTNGPEDDVRAYVNVIMKDWIR